MESKQVIIVRTDLKMKIGKTSVQVAHASMKAIFDLMKEKNDLENKGRIIKSLTYDFESAFGQWINRDFTKIVLGVDSERTLDILYEYAETAKLPRAMIIDNGTTVFGKPTKTCIALGPAWSDEIDRITGNLRLL